MRQLFRTTDVVAELRIHPWTLKRFERQKLVTLLRDRNGVRCYTRAQVESLRRHIGARSLGRVGRQNDAAPIADQQR